MTVGLAIIARDEADNLPVLLDSVRGAFDQVVLCDTGSTDRTVEVFRSWAGAQDWGPCGLAPWKVGSFAWRDDFAAARNHADSLLDTDWSSWADCDDVVRGAGNLRGLAAAAPEVGAFVAGYDYARLANGTTVSHLKRERLVRRSLARGWEHRVHEAQRFEGEAALVGPDVCEWVHRKWVLEPGEPPPAPERNLRILRRWVAEEPDHAFALSCLALELRSRGKHREAVRWFRRHLRARDPEQWPERRAQMLRRLATCHLLLGEPWPAIGAAHAALRTAPSWPDSALTLAEGHLALQRWERAERWAREALRRGPPETTLEVNPLDYEFGPRLVLAGALAGRGRFREAIAVGEEARELVPGHAELEQQLRAWRRRELAPRPTGRRAAAGAAMVAALLGVAPGALAAPPSGPHNELGAVMFNGIPIPPPSTTGFIRPFLTVGGGHQLKGSQYVPFVSTFSGNGKLVNSIVIPGFGRENSDVVSIFPFDGTTLLGIDQTTTGSVAALTRFGQGDPQCKSAFGPRRPLSFDRGYLSPFLIVGALPPTDTGFFLDLFNPSTCRDIASIPGQFDPARATDVNAFLFGPHGVLVAGGAGTGPTEEPVSKFYEKGFLDFAGFTTQPPLGGGLQLFPGLTGTFTGGIAVGSTGFDLVGLDRARGLVFGACGGPTGQLDTRCGANGSRVLLDLDPSRFNVFNPAIANGPKGLVAALPYEDLQAATSHVLFLNLDPATLAERFQRDVAFPGTTRIPGISIGSDGRVYAGLTTRNLADLNNPLNNNRIGITILNPDFTPAFPTFIQNQSPNTPPPYAPAPISLLDDIATKFFAAHTTGGGARAQAAAANQRRIVRVQFAAVRLSGKGKSLKCAWLKNRRAQFVADAPIAGSCQGARWVTARKGRGGKWTLRLSRRLPAGRYFAYSRATNAAGVTQRSFSERKGNRRPFRIH